MGDSQTWHWYYSAECFLRRRAVDLERRGVTANKTLVLELSRVSYPVYVKPTCIHLQGNTRVCAVSIDSFNVQQAPVGFRALLVKPVRSRRASTYFVLPAAACM